MSMTDLFKRNINILSAVIIIALGFIVYSNSLNGKFVYDDEYLVKDNAFIKSLSRLPSVFYKDVGSGADRAYSFYRPVLIITYALDYAIWNVKPFGYHLSSTIFHILAALCVYWFIAILFESELLALFTAALFVAHPVHVEAVSYISGRSDPLVLIFTLLTFIFYLKQLRTDKAWGWWTGMVLSYSLAILSREITVTLPILMLLYHYIYREKVKWKAYLPLLGMAIFYVAIRMTLLNYITMKITYDTTFLDRLPGAFVAIFNYARLLLFPFDLRMEYGYIKPSFLDPRVIAGAVIIISLACCAVKLRKSVKIISFCIGWFFIAILPTLNLYPINAYMAEHWLYLPSIGFFLAVASGIAVLWNKKGYRALGLAIILAMTLYYSFLTIKQNVYWSDPIYFYERTLKYVPQNFGFYTNLGREYAARGNGAKAIECYQKAIDIEPRFGFPYNNIGNIYLEMGELEKAVPYYKKSLELDPNHAFTYNNLGNLYMRLNKFAEAVPLYKKAVEMMPNNGYMYNNLGRACLNAGMPDEALAYFKKALDIDPNIAYAYTNLAELYISKNDSRSAVEWLEKAVKLDPSNSTAVLGLAIAYYTLKENDKAISYYDKAVSLGAKPAPALTKEIESIRK
jgi:tetratricopeptide (TPR) repeat protein